MKQIHITSLSRENRERVRFKAAKLFAKGVAQADIAKKFNVTRAAVNQWRKAWEKRGKEGLASKGHPGFKSELTEEKKKEFRRAIIKGPLAYGYPTNLWTLPRLAAVLKKVGKVDFSEVWTWHIVREMGFTPQKPQVKAKERNEQAIQDWKAKKLPSLKKMGGKTRILSGI